MAFLLGNTALAAVLVNEVFVETGLDKIEFIGKYPGGQFGANIAVGDFNGDMIDDIIIGSPYASTNNKKLNGAVSVLFGGNYRKAGVVSLKNTLPDLVIYGANSGDQFGTSVAMGDFNSDGVSDIAVGAHNALNDWKRSGRVYTIYGQNGWSNQKVDFADTNLSFAPQGQNNGDGFGMALASGDMNGDGVDDLFIGAPYASTPNAIKSGAAYVYLGSKDGLNPLYGSVFFGQSENERFGSSIGIGDINGNGFNDVLIGAYLAQNGNLDKSGKVYIYEGANKYSPVIRYPASSVEGIEDNAWFGFDFDIADINYDGKDDLAVTSFPYSGQRSAAKVSIFFGSDNLLKEGTGLIYDQTFANQVLLGQVDNNLLGSSVNITDLDRDGLDDFIVGAPGVGNPISEEEGAVYISYGNGEVSLIHGQNPDDWFGFESTHGDFNDDGKEDLIIGSMYSDAEKSINNGKVFVLFGNGHTFGDLKPIADYEDKMLNRDELISIVVNSFDIKNTKADRINSCYDYREFCLFNFMARSSFDEIKLEPELILYPDITPEFPYYEDITIATILGLVNGYIDEPESPFRPDLLVSRIQAFKIVFGASDLVDSKYKFELAEYLTSQKSYFADVDPNISHMWWYPRYTNFAVENSIISDGGLFRPDEKMTMSELTDLINRTKDYLKSRDEKTKS